MTAAAAAAVRLILARRGAATTVTARAARASPPAGGCGSTAGGTAAFRASTSTRRSTSSSSSSSSSSASGGGGDGGVPLLPTAAAAAAGVITVTAASAAVEHLTGPSCPDFDPRKTRYDQSTFSGRFCQMILKCDPGLLLNSTERCEVAKSMVDDYQELVRDPKKLLEPVNPEDCGCGKDMVAKSKMRQSLTKLTPDGKVNVNHTLWEAQRVYSAALHPDTGEVIPPPFRMSGYVPFNGPICVAMVASTTTPTLLFWNWVNQSQNALINYFNRNAAGGELSNEVIAKSYAAAVGSALTVAFGLATFIQRRYDPAAAKKLLRFVAFPSSVVASSLNCYIVRSPEIDTGIPLVDKEGKNVLPGETSQIAATRGVISTTASRALLQAPVYFLPPVLLYLPIFKSMTTRNPAITVPLTTFLLLVSFGIGLPATVGIFPQISEIDAKDLEEKYQHLRDPEGRPIEKLYYNKGL